MAADRARPVAVVTGGAAGIGAAIAEELGRRGAYVVTLDPMVAVDGSPSGEAVQETTADRIVAAGGAARASNTSVTDEDAVRALFEELVGEHGSLDAVVNVAGITRQTGFTSGSDDDWERLLDVHLNGYLTVLRCALPIMAAAGRGVILGVTSGSGWRAADAGAYSCAKRAVASLTWQIGKATPTGVVVNALSPIAATRMITNALSRMPQASDSSGRSAASGGVALMAAPPPENLGPIGAYLASEAFAWCTGEIVFSNGAEVSLVAPPRLLEAVRTADVPSLPAAVATALTGAFAAAEPTQVSSGGSVPRFADAFDASATAPTTARTGRCVLVTDDAAWRTAVGETLATRGFECVDADAGAVGIAGAADALARAAGDGAVDAVVIARRGATGAGTAPAGDAAWQQILASHASVADDIRADAAWVRAAADRANATEVPARIVVLTDATTPGGRSRAMALAQLSRASHGATGDRVDTFAVAVESSGATAQATTSELVGQLVAADGVGVLSGAELVVGDDWLGLRSHPNVAGTVVYGGPEVPAWVDGVLRRLVQGEHAARG